MSDDTVTYTAELKLPTIEANLMKYGEIRELKHPWFKCAFEAGKDGNQVEMIRFKNTLNAKGYSTHVYYRAHVIEPDKILITKGSISMMLVLNGLPPFSDSTIEQIDYIFETLDQEVRDSMQAEVDRIMSEKPLQKVEVCKGIPVKRSPYRDGDWFESCKSDDHD
jgi:hypothetical protein